MPKNTPRSFTGRLISFLSSEWCFRLLIVFFILEALWIALGSLYPMAFDEEFHLGVIKLYAHHISPIWSSQPAGADAFGPVGRNPSYLYHWLMSFPYRLVSAIFSDQNTQVIILRLINIGLFATALSLYRRLLLRTGASRAIVHFCLALFILVPIAPLLAAQINYDNLLLPLTALVLLLTVDFSQELRRKRFKLKKLLWLAVITTLACLVKYAFLPIALAIAIYLVVRLRQTYRGLGTDGLWSDVKTDWRLIPRPAVWLLVGLLVVSLGLFAQRYAVNLTRYHAPAPRCDQVLTIRQCSARGPWIRSYKDIQTKPANAETSPLVFTAGWLYGMWHRTFFAVAGPGNSYRARGPFILPAVGAIVFFVSALTVTAITRRRVWGRYDRRVLWLFVAMIAVYTVALWTEGNQAFLRTGRLVAINGRYLLPVYPLLMIIVVLGANTYLKNRRQLKMLLAGLALLCMLWGGGALTYVLRSSDAWYWTDSPIEGASRLIRETVGPLVPGNSDPAAFRGHHGT